MEDSQRNSAGAGSRRQSSRLQRRAPSSLQISRSVDWKVAIPLLSPLASSPTALDLDAWQQEQQTPPEQQQQQSHRGAETEKVVFKKWQHPAAPFCYEPAPPVPPFVPV